MASCKKKCNATKHKWLTAQTGLTNATGHTRCRKWHCDWPSDIQGAFHRQLSFGNRTISVFSLIELGACCVTDHVLLFAAAGPCWLPGSLQTPLCLSAVQAWDDIREQCCCDATELPHPGHTEGLPDQCCQQGHWHRCKVHRSWSCHSRSSWIRCWYWDSVRQSHHRLR